MYASVQIADKIGEKTPLGSLKRETIVTCDISEKMKHLLNSGGHEAFAGRTPDGPGCAGPRQHLELSRTVAHHLITRMTHPIDKT